MNMQATLAPAPQAAPNAIDGLRYRCQVVDFAPLTAGVTRVRLRPAEGFPRPQAGQYLELVLDDGTARPFSIANDVTGEGRLELHIEARPDSRALTAILAQLATRGTIDAKAPAGTVRLRRPRGPQLFLAAGTGFAQIKALIEACVLGGHSRTPLYLFWGTDQPHQRYLEAQVNAWCRQSPNLHYRPLDWQDGDRWESAVTAEGLDLTRCQVYACGSPQRVYQALEQLVRRGLPETHMQSDVFAFAPPPRAAGVA